MKTKLSPLVKLRLNLSVKDLAYRFGISTGLVSQYVTTWICFLYCQLKEIDWMPSTEQVAGTLPCAFKEKYPSTYVIIDASDVFIETSSDLHLQCSTWSNYKHHNTGKFLIVCTPNGVIYVGSFSDSSVSKYLSTSAVSDEERGGGIKVGQPCTNTDDLVHLPSHRQWEVSLKDGKLFNSSNSPFDMNTQGSYLPPTFHLISW